MSFGTVAVLVTIITVLAFAAVGIAYARRFRMTAEGYIVGGRSAGGMAAMATLVASVMGAWILFSPAEAATWAGLIAVVGYGVGQAAPILAFMVLGPRMRRLMPQGHSLTEFVWFRYGRAMYGLVLVIAVFYMFVFLAAEMGAIARAVQFVADVPLLVTLVLVALATLAYTVYGGLRASMFTDNLQFLLIFPLMVLVLAVALVELGGWSVAFDAVNDVDPALLSPTHVPGIELGITLIIAILAANLFHQGFWQRVYACRSDGELRKGFLLAGLLVIPLVVMGGLFGLWAIGQGLSTAFDPIALFKVATDVLPDAVLIALLVLALVLVMSSMDTLLNGIASIFTSDLPRLNPSIKGATLLTSSRLITALLILPAIVVGFFFDSVLYLFFIADLVCAGAVVPVFLGMYSRRLTGRAALISAVLGIAAGAVFFPNPDLGGWWTWTALTDAWHVLASGNTLASFLIAVVASSVVATVLMAVDARRNAMEVFDFSRLQDEVRAIEG